MDVSLYFYGGCFDCFLSGIAKDNSDVTLYYQNESCCSINLLEELVCILLQPLACLGIITLNLDHPTFFVNNLDPENKCNNTHST